MSAENIHESPLTCRYSFPAQTKQTSVKAPCSTCLPEDALSPVRRRFRPAQQSGSLLGRPIWARPLRSNPLLSVGVRAENSESNSSASQRSISAACIDSAGHRTDEVYRFCNTRLARHVYAVVGRDGPRPIWPRRAGKSKKYHGSPVWTIGVDSAKEAVYSSLRVLNHGPGYAHFPIAYELEFFTQLTAEEVRTRYKNGKQVRYWFKPAAVRNEALDRRAYALAALRSRPVPWEILVRGAPTEPPDPIPPTDDGSLPPSTKPAIKSAEPKPNANPGTRPVRFRIR